MKVTPISKPLSGEQIVGVRPEMGSGSHQSERVTTVVAMNKEAQTRLVHHR